MKFRDPKTGKVYSNITTAWESFCAGLKDACLACPLTASKTGRNLMCNEFVVGCETEAARLMGLEVVEDDIDLINRISKTPLMESEVYTFSMRLCDNEVGRDYERFSIQALKKMSEMFIGKCGILGRQCSARIYRTELVRDAETITAAGDEYCYLKGWAYMLRNEQGKDVIAEIEVGIKKEVSVGCAVERSVCSICGADIGTCRHVKGKTYDGLLCFAELRNPTDVFEWSFVATPAKKKEEPMEKKDNPRICRVLGVEVGDEWDYPGFLGPFRINQGGYREHKSEDGVWYLCQAEEDLAEIIKHKYRIIRRPRFTEEEAEIAKGLQRVWPDGKLLRRTPDDLVLTSYHYGFAMPVPADMFPSLRPGQTVGLNEIILPVGH